VTPAQTAFGQRLRAARERQGLSVDTLAARTKIKASLFVELERGEVGHWPAGIFRRAFFREYASAIGLDPEPLLPDFVRLFPEPSSGQTEAATVRSDGLRMTLERGRTWTAATVARRLMGALAELSVLALLSAALARAAGLDFAPTVAVAGAAYWTIAHAAVGRGGMGWWLERRAQLMRRQAPAHQLRIVPKQAASAPAVAGTENQKVSPFRTASR
jgi:transcriptional regulator with XRE-family HTH domain